MDKILLISDCHITDEGDLISGLDPLQRLRKVLDHAVTHHPDASHLILLGDLAHNGTTSQYRRLEGALSGVTIPAVLMLGNHDRRTAFASVFGGDADEFQQRALAFGGTNLICLDSLDENAPDTHSGLLCDARKAWLKAQLDANRGDFIVLIHHHLIPSGFDGMDAIGLRNAQDVFDILKADGRCQMVINGHIHRTIFASRDGIAQAMIKSPCHQMPMVLGPGSSKLSVAEPGGYGVLLLHPHGPILHHVDVGLPDANITQDAAS